jgi:hypothetical protein
MPDHVVALVAGAVLALLIYSIISSLGGIFFKRTAQHESASARVLYGSSGALVGLIFGAFLVWIAVVSIRSIGSVADGGVRAQAAAQGPEPTQNILSPSSPQPRQEPPPLVNALARLKNSIELGRVGEVVKKADPVPDNAYDALARAGQVLGNPQSAERFLTFPGAQQLSEHPKIVALRNDPEIAELLGQGRLFDLLQNEKILAAANDPTLVAEIRKLDIRQALDYATTAEPAP